MKTANTIAIVVALLAAAYASGQTKPTLNVGDPAPKILLGKTFKGEPAKEIESGKIYVFDFWATRCGPCVASIPHLSSLAKKYEGQITFTGISVQKWPNGEQNDTLPLVDAFVKTPTGEAMQYNMAADTDNGFMVKTWFGAAGYDSIPVLIVVGKEGKILWMGRPGDIDPILELVVSDKFDLQTAKAERVRQVQREKTFDKDTKVIWKSLDAKDYRGAEAECDSGLAAQLGGQSAAFNRLKLMALCLSGDGDGALAYTRECVKTGRLEPAWAANMMAETEGLSKDCYLYAVEILQPGTANADKEMELVKDPEVLFHRITLARAFYRAGNRDEALETIRVAVKQYKSLAISPSDKNGSSVGKECEDLLAKYEARG